MDVDWRALALLEMFPETSYEIALRHLLDNDGDIERASESLLSENLIINAHESWIVEEGGEPLEHDQSDDETARQQRLMELTGFPLDDCVRRLEQCGYDVPKALVEAVVGYEATYKQLVMEWEDKRCKAKKVSPTSRVQASYNSRPGIKDDVSRPYIYSEKNPEVAKLAVLVYNDPKLVEINWNFYIDMLIFCAGDVTRVMCMAIYLMEQDATQLTYTNKCYEIYDDDDEALLLSAYDSMSEVADSKLDYSNIPSGPLNTERDFQMLRRKKSGGNRTNTNIQPVKPQRNPTFKHNDVEGVEDHQDQLLAYELDRVKERNQLDLHGFHTATAKQAVLTALSQWWKDELEERRVRGTEGSAVQALHVEPLIVITGRGSHSEGGIARVRIQVEKLLAKTAYKYKELTSSFVVYGKK